MQTDLCIIGSGVAGSLIADQLGKHGTSITILEAGPRHPFEKRLRYAQDMARGRRPWESNLPARDRFRSVGSLNYAVNARRVKGVGGTTLHWQGYTPRFHIDDFKTRSRFGRGVDWPLSYEELEPYYGRAESELGVSGTTDNPFAPPRSTPYPLPAFPIGYEEQLLAERFAKAGLRYHSYPQARTSQPYQDRSACMTFGVCSACPIRARYSGDIHAERAEKHSGVSIIDGAAVVRLETDGNRRIRRAIYVTHDGSEHAVEAKLFLLAAGAIESARLLLLSAQQGHRDGLANSSGCVGSYFMDHIGRRRYVDVDYPLYPFRKGFHSAYSEQFYDHGKRDEYAPIRLYWLGAGDTVPQIANQIIADSGRWGDELRDDIARSLRKRFGHTFVIGYMAEPEPSEKNFVKLDPTLKDLWGYPAPQVSLNVSSYEEAAYKVFDAKVQEFIEVADGKNVNLKIGYGGHQSGTCRMGNDAASSVVDKNLKAHDLDNLFIVGASTFPGIAALEPTLTISATALRLADHLQSLSL